MEKYILPDMQKYPKIQTIFKRDDDKKIIFNDWTLPEFEYLQNCLWYWFETELRHIKFINNNIEKIYDIDLYALNSQNNIKDMFNFFNIKYDDIETNVDKNENKRKTILSKENYQEAYNFLKYVPEDLYLRIKNNYSLKDDLPSYL